MGARIVPDGLREAGWQIATMDEVYGPQRSMTIADVDWIREAAARGDCIITKDARIAKNYAEAKIVYMCDAKVFTLTNAAVPGIELLSRLLHHQKAIFRWATNTPPPFVAGVNASRVSRLFLAYPPQDQVVI